MIENAFQYSFFQTSTERLMYKPINAIDLTASQLTNPPIDTTVQELEDVLGRRLTVEEIQVTLENVFRSGCPVVRISKKSYMFFGY